MDKSAALEFIGLKEPFSEELVHDRYKERLQYFRMLYAHAPNKSAERVQQRNLEKLEEVKRILLQALAVRQQYLEQKFGPGVPKPVIAAPPPPLVDLGVTGWLVLHTEHRKTVAFELFQGINFIGRKNKPDADHCVVIEDDPYISRTHAFIKCRNNAGTSAFELFDGDGSKPSANGVFMNGHPVRVDGSVVLRDGDTIQVGTTKLVFRQRKEHSTQSGEVAKVLGTGFVRTVDVGK